MAKDDILRKASQRLGELVDDNEKARKQPEQDRRDFISSLAKEIGQVVVGGLSPLIAGLTMQSEKDREKMMRAIASIDVKVPPIPAPTVNVPKINVPTPKVTVIPPQVKVPQINVPKTEINMPEIMDVRVAGVNNKAPMPVIMMDTKGKPMPFSLGAGGGGKSDYLKIKDILTSTGASLISDDGKLKVDASVSASITADYGSGEVGDNTLRVVQATDAVASVNIVSGSASGTEYNDGDTASTPAGGVIMGDTGEESGNIYALALGSGVSGSSVLRVLQASDAVSSVYVTGANGSIAVTIEDGDGNTRTTFPIEGSVAVSGITGSVASYLIDGDGNYRDVVMVDAASSVAVIIEDGDGNTRTTFPIEGDIGTVTTVTGITNSVAASLVDSSGVQYSGSNPVPVSQQALSSSTDSVVTKPINVRGSLSTAYATISTDAATTLIAASAGNYLDLVWITGANQSDGAVLLDVRDVSGGNVVMSFEIPANATSGVAPATPFPQGNQGNAWTIYWGDSDITGTTVDVSALFNVEAA